MNRHLSKISFVFAIVGLLLTTGSHPAAGQGLVPASGPDPPDPALLAPALPPASADDACMNDDPCHKAVTTARLLSQSGQYEAALAGYQSAYVATPVQWLLVNIGRMQQRLGRLEDAITSYRRFLDGEDKQGYPVHRAKALAFLAQAERELASRQALLVQSRPPDAATTTVARPNKLPVYKRWWFWTLVGTAVAGVAVGAGLGAYSRKPDLTGVPVIQSFRN